MKKIYPIIIGVCAIWLPNTLSYAQRMEDSITAEMPCYNTKELFQSLRKKYKEVPLLTGTASDEAKSTVSVWMNPIDKSWSIIATSNDLSCVVGVGTDIKLINYKKGTST